MCLFFIAGVTILLSLTVFLNLVAESMPTTSDAVPLIGTKFEKKKKKLEKNYTERNNSNYESPFTGLDFYDLFFFSIFVFFFVFDFGNAKLVSNDLF